MVAAVYLFDEHLALAAVLHALVLGPLHDRRVHCVSALSAPVVLLRAPSADVEPARLARPLFHTLVGDLNQLAVVFVAVRAPEE